MISTKEQEREALKKIRKILEGLGDDSYLATAFEGCCEDAESNIEMDGAFSFHSRWTSAMMRNEELEQKISNLQADLRKAAETERLLSERIDEKDRIIDDMQKRIANLFMLTLPTEQADEYGEFLSYMLNENLAQILMCTDQMAECADNQSFSHLVKMYKEARESRRMLIELKDLINRLDCRKEN